MKTLSDSTRARDLLAVCKGKTNVEIMALMREQFRQVREEVTGALVPSVGGIEILGRRGGKTDAIDHWVANIASCRFCGKYFHMPTGHDCPGLLAEYPITKQERPMPEPTEAEIREGYRFLTTDQLRDVADNEGERQVVRDVALSMLAEREAAPATLSEREIALAGGRQPMIDAMVEAKNRKYLADQAEDWRPSYAEFSDSELLGIAEDEDNAPLSRGRARIVLDERQAMYYRANFAPLSTAGLRMVVDNDGTLPLQREVAQNMLDERGALVTLEHARQVAEQEAQMAREAAERQTARLASAAVVDDTPPVAKPEPEASSANHAAAIAFCQRFTAAGLYTGVQQSSHVQGRRVVDGWTVNVRDEENEIGFVAVWWGRAHFLAYAEIAGHRERTDEAADLLLALLHRAREHQAEQGGA